MKKTEKANLSNALNGEHFEHVRSVVEVLEANILESFNLSVQLQQLVNLFKQEDEIYKKVLGEERSKELAKLDKERDDAFRNIMNTITAMQLSPVAATKAVADELAYATKTYKGSNSAKLDVETAQLYNMVQVLKSPTNTPKVTTLGLTEAVNKMNQANEAYREVSAYRDADKSADKALGTMKEIRPQVDEAYFTIMQAIDAIYASNDLSSTPNALEHSASGSIIDAVNNYVMHLNDSINLRLSTQKTKREADITVDKKMDGVVRNLAAEGMTVEKIMKITDLKYEQVTEILKKKEKK